MGPFVSSLERSLPRPEVESDSLRRPLEVAVDLKACETWFECAVKDEAPSNETLSSSSKVLDDLMILVRENRSSVLAGDLGFATRV